MALLSVFLYAVFVQVLSLWALMEQGCLLTGFQWACLSAHSSCRPILLNTLPLTAAGRCLTGSHKAKSPSVFSSSVCNWCTQLRHQSWGKLCNFSLRTQQSNLRTEEVPFGHCRQVGNMSTSYKSPSSERANCISAQNSPTSIHLCHCKRIPKAKRFQLMESTIRAYSIPRIHTTVVQFW